MTKTADLINRLQTPALEALRDALATRLAAKDGRVFADVREYGAGGGGPHKDYYREDAGHILNMLSESELSLAEIAEVLVEQGIPA